MSLYFSEPSTCSPTSEIDDTSTATPSYSDTQASKKADPAGGIGSELSPPSSAI
jgi:hypothetical protein